MFLACIPLLLYIHSCNSTSGNTVYRNNAQCLQKKSCLLSGIYECRLGGWQRKNNMNIPLLWLRYYASSSSLLNWVEGGGIYIIASFTSHKFLKCWQLCHHHKSWYRTFPSPKNLPPSSQPNPQESTNRTPSPDHCIIGTMVWINFRACSPSLSTRHLRLIQVAAE